MTLFSITYQWTPQRTRNPNVKFSFKYLNYVVLGMNILENWILEQNSDYLLYKATNLKSTTFPTKPDLFSWSFSDQKKYTSGSWIEIYVIFFFPIFRGQLIWQKMKIQLFHATRNPRSFHSLDRQERKCKFLSQDKWRGFMLSAC